MAAAVEASLSRLGGRPLGLNHLKLLHRIADRGWTSLAVDSAGTVGGNFAGCPLDTAVPTRR